MHYFKRFGDVCSGIAAFIGAMYLFRTFMGIKVTDEEIGLRERLKQFLSPAESPANQLMAVLVVMLALSAVAGLVLSRLPHITVIFSLPPLLLTLDMIKSGYIVDYPLLHLLLAAIAFLSGIFECARLDRRDGKRRAAIAANIISVGFAVFLLYIYKAAQRVASYTAETSAELNVFKQEIFTDAPNMDMEKMLVFAAIFLVLVALSLSLRDIFFVDAILALPPIFVLMYYWEADKLTVHPEVIIGFAICIFVARLVPTFMCNGKAE